MPPLFDIPDGVSLGIISAEGVILMVLLGLVGTLWKRITDIENNYGSLWKDRESDAIKKRQLGDHIDVLEAHIWADKGPPPPPRPAV